jgi:signal transduction histidine kinase
MKIRRYMIVGVLSIVVLPWLIYFFIHMLNTYPEMVNGHLKPDDLTKTMEIISKNQENWSNPSWQNHLKSELKREGLDVEIQSPSNQMIFQSVQHGHNHWVPSQQLMVVQDGKWVGTVKLSETRSADPIAAIGAVLAAILAIIFVGFQIGRNVIRPLESMSRAAFQIAEGDLDFELANSKAVEIIQVRGAFQVMVNGLRNSFAERQKLEEERTFFIGAIAHDLRTPLFSLRGYLDGMEQGIASTPDKMAHYISVCKEKAAHLDRLVSDLFAFTRLEYMEQTLQSENFNLSDALDKTVSSMVHRARQKGITLKANLPDAQFLVTGDPHLLERAITNLLDNALRYTPNNGKVIIDLQRQSEKMVIKIRDTGPGFASDDLGHIFEPMFRGDTSRNLSTGGAGLGLTIARRIFRLHGGELFAENSPEGGALLTGWISQN